MLRQLDEKQNDAQDPLLENEETSQDDQGVVRIGVAPQRLASALVDFDEAMAAEGRLGRRQAIAALLAIGFSNGEYSQIKRTSSCRHSF